MRLKGKLGTRRLSRKKNQEDTTFRGNDRLGFFRPNFLLKTIKNP